MAEVAAMFLIEKIGNALITEGIVQVKSLYNSVKNVRREMEEIKCRLELLWAFLKIAVKYANMNGLVVAWVKQVRKLVFVIEDLIDEYAYIMGSLDKEGGLTAHICNGWRMVMNKKALNDIAAKLHCVKNTLQTLLEDKNTFGIEIPTAADVASTSTSIAAVRVSQQLAEAAHTTPDKNIIGIDKHRDLLIKWLKDDQNSGEKVISVLGMGGVGKTTLVTSVYNSPSIVEHFQCRAWVSVSQNYGRDLLLKKLIKELHRDTESTPEGLESMDYRNLVGELQKFLKDNSYLIILDDVWEPIVWSEMSVAMSGNNLNSRVVITTRIEDVARVVCESRILKLLPLDDSTSMILFCHYAFQKQKERDCPQHLKEWANKIVDHCGGLPLALVWVGNLLAQKEHTKFAWKSVHEVLVSSGEKSEVTELKRINTILSLSIKNLPYYLRTCFLYCSIFPEDYEIKRKTLLKLWVSEGFIAGERAGSTKMEVAEDYLNQLIGQCILEVAKRNQFGRVKKIKIHDVVRVMIVEKQRADNLYEQWDENTRRREIKENIRCLSVIKLNDPYGNNYQPRLRSLHLFAKASQLPIGNFKLLRVLNVQNSGIERLPEEVGTLFNLRYLSIRRTRVKKIPRDIRRLLNLQTLDALHSYVRVLPTGVSKLDKLEHLLLTDIEVGLQVRNLTNLQTLKIITATDELVHDLGSLTEMRTLKIKNVSSVAQCLELAASIAKMKNLISLAVKCSKELNCMQLDETSLPSQLLKLALYGSLNKGLLPKCLIFHSNMKSLRLVNSKLREDPAATLAPSFPNLQFLSLESCCVEEVDKLCFPARSFPNLKVLYIWFLHVKVIDIHKESLVGLEKMSLQCCTQLNTWPAGIEHLTNLKKVYMFGMFDPEKQNNTSERYFEKQISSYWYIYIPKTRKIKR